MNALPEATAARLAWVAALIGDTVERDGSPVAVIGLSRRVLTTVEERSHGRFVFGRKLLATGELERVDSTHAEMWIEPLTADEARTRAARADACFIANALYGVAEMDEHNGLSADDLAAIRKIIETAKARPA